MRPNERNCQNCTEARSFYLKPVLLGCLQIKGEQPHKKQSLGFCMVVLVGWESIEPAVSKKKIYGGTSGHNDSRMLAKGTFRKTGCSGQAALLR